MDFEPRPEQAPAPPHEQARLPVWPPVGESPPHHGHAPPPLPPPAGRVTKAWRPGPIIGVVLVGVVLLGGGAWALRDRVPLLRKWRGAETAEQKYRDMRRALASPGQAGAGVTPADLAGLDAMLTQLATASRQGHANRFAAAFDAERLFDEVVARGDLPREFTGAAPRRAFASGFRQGIANDLEDWKATFGWARHRIRRVERVGGGGEALVYLTTYEDDGLTNRWRIWAHRQSAAVPWRLYDFEELLTGVRLSTLTGMTLAGGKLAPWAGAMNDIGKAGVALTRADLDAGEQALARCESVKFPPEIEGLRLILRASLQIQRGQYEPALETLDAAAAARPDSPAPDYHRAQAYAWLERHAESLAATERFEATFGPEADNLYAKGAALENLGRLPEALAAYRAGLDDEPDSFDNLVALGAALPAAADAAEGGKAELRDRFARSSMSPEFFRQVAEHFDEAGDAAALRAVLDAYALKRPADPYAAYYEARLHARADRHRAAAETARAAMPRAEGDALAALRHVYFDAVYQSGKVTEAYRQAPAGEERAVAFRELATRLQQAEDDDGLAELVEARQADAPDDPYAHYSAGWVHHTKGDFQAADRAYAAAASAGGLDEVWTGVLRDAHVDARYRLKRGLSALAEIGPPTGPSRSSPASTRATRTPGAWKSCSLPGAPRSSRIRTWRCGRPSWRGCARTTAPPPTGSSSCTAPPRRRRRAPTGSRKRSRATCPWSRGSCRACSAPGATPRRCGSRGASRRRTTRATSWCGYTPPPAT